MGQSRWGERKPALKKGCAGCARTCRSIPHVAVLSFILVSGGVALAYLSAMDVNTSLDKVGSGADQVTMVTRFIIIPLIIAILTNWMALLMCFQASGRSREVLF